MPKRPALIFDFGNVVAFFDYGHACERLGRPLGLTGEALLARVREAGLTTWVRRYETGELTAQAFADGVLRLAGLSHLNHAEFATAWCDIFQLNEPVAELVSALKEAGYTLVLGSNTNDLHAAHFRRQFEPTLAHFDALVLSYEVGHLKPAREFYEACAAAAGVPPAECVFIDDLPENIEGARAAGLAGLLYRDPHSLVQDLRRLGVSAAGT